MWTVFKRLGVLLIFRQNIINLQATSWNSYQSILQPGRSEFWPLGPAFKESRHSGYLYPLGIGGRLYWSEHPIRGQTDMP